MHSASISHSEHERPALTGLYYDGISTRAHPVFVTIANGQCRISGKGIERSLPLAEVSPSERLDGAHRILRFRDGSSCELQDSGRLSAFLDRAGRGESLVQRLQRSWRWVALSFLLLAVVLSAGYRWGLPWAAEKLAFRLPVRVLSLISQQALSSLDGRVLQPTTLTIERQQQLRERFERIIFPSRQALPTRVEFRSSTMFGANAFALPDGTIVFIDKLVQLADNDDQIVAVYAHEAGHVALRHGMRQIIQRSVVALVLAAYFGDVSSLGAALSGWLLEAKYSRSFEQDADLFAAATLRQNNLSPKLLASMLLKLEEDHRRLTGSNDKNGKTHDYLSSHPATEERIKYLESF
jgi:Zn-dependent protease with chaperone function